jgi:phosphotriesterase-related protein
MTVHVRTVLGPVPVDELGHTAPHEHVFLDSRDGFSPDPCHISPDLLVTRETRPAVDRYPLGVIDNLLLDDIEVAVEELSTARAAGLATVVEATSLHTGRLPELLAEASRRSGMHIVMGSGFYMERAMPDHVLSLSEAELVDLLDADMRDGEKTPAGVVRPGVMGEIGLSVERTPAERRSLRAAARVAAAHGVPLSIHLPAWARIGHAALDEIETAVGCLRGVLLGHLNPMAHDVGYLRTLAERGAWLGLDMLGNALDYGEGRRSPNDETNLSNIMRLLDEGLGGRLLLSSDVGQKNMLRRNGGQGYAHAVSRILPALAQRGADAVFCAEATRSNPAQWFREAAQ